MKLLWLCNVAPSAVAERETGKTGSGLWMDQMLAGLRAMDNEVRILYPCSRNLEGRLDPQCSYAGFRCGEPQHYQPEQEYRFRSTVKEFQPDVIHIWGTEFSHALAMVRAAEAEGALSRVVISLQGVCSAIALHYTEGIPGWAQRRYTFRDLIRRDNILQQKRKFALRGAHEAQALALADHVMGRTDWDRACANRLHPGIQYHFCNETLRSTFYTGQWQYASCRKHRIFASSCEYPVKGFHYLLEAAAQMKQEYPDLTIAVPGRSFLDRRGMAGIRRNSYQKYLARLTRQYGLEEQLEFLGDLTAEQMKENYLSANVFVLPSTVENSPNSLGEAMLLGVPSVAAHVGGVTSMLTDGQEGWIYQSTAPYMLAYDIKTVFDLGPEASRMGQQAREHALKTHCPEANLQRLLEIYREVGGI